VPMMVLRDDECVMAPSDDFVLAPEDELLLSGEAGARRALGMTLIVDATREYVMTGRHVPASWAWRHLIGYHRDPGPEGRGD
jgi:voltage-gated potassium channel